MTSLSSTKRPDIKVISIKDHLTTSTDRRPMTSIALDITQRPLVNTTTDKIDKRCKFCITSIGFLAGASIGGAITISLMVISTFLLILLIRATRKHKGIIAALKPTEMSRPERPKKLELEERLLSRDDYEISDVHQISMNMNECYETPYVYEEL